MEEQPIYQQPCSCIPHSYFLCRRFLLLDGCN
uniref:Uncharacterized protein n=1 Tax=Phage sp. ctPtC7 TaxID=2825794 RepID=A0A8S5PCH9_9VIRU|nr:MAG TPA: hypothetical protein [Phage sp. ctPtC7]